MTIDEKFKDSHPVDTVNKIKKILNDIGIEVQERWLDSGLENCWSLAVSEKHSIVPSANGKGVTKELARASAYAEFIERLQSGLFIYKLQSAFRDPNINLHGYTPDVKYMTVDELIENGEWMDYIIETYNKSLTRAQIAEHCRAYSCADDGKIMTEPYYSLFEDKYVYLPIGFVEQIFTTNGCCAGNTREEAWVHALSELMERHATVNMFVSGKAAPEIPEEVLNRFPTVSNIINEIKKAGKYDISIFDYSIGNGFPVISTRIINKETHSYSVNVAADPILEIAIQRTLTETFQGKTIYNFTSKHGGKILKKVSDFPLENNIFNQLECGSGLHTIDYFANELTCDRTATDFADNSNMNNKELLAYLMNLYKEIGKPVYIRNFSFLGFPCYKFVVPGFSEARVLKLNEAMPNYLIADKACDYLKDIASAGPSELSMVYMYYKSISNLVGWRNDFRRLSGLPIETTGSRLLLAITMSYVTYKLNLFDEAKKFLQSIINSKKNDIKLRKYFECVEQYIELKSSGISEEKIKSVIKKFHAEEFADELYANLENGNSPFDKFLLKCDKKNCENCRYNSFCAYQSFAAMVAKTGEVYKTFAHGQDRKEFQV